MKYADINKRFSEIVTEYLNKGYTFNTATMGGSQGEVAKVDLTDGTDIIRISIESFSNWQENIEGLEIIIGRDTKGQVIPNGSNRYYNTIWGNDLEIIRTERFYRINHHAEFFGTEDDAKKASEVRKNRWRYQTGTSKGYQPSAKALEIAKRIVRTKLGYSRIKSSDVRISKYDDGYIVSYRNHSYKLH